VADHCINTNKAWVIDADGLNILAAHEQKERLGPRVILTPHPGEAARLLNIDSNKVESDRFSALNALRDNYEAQILLKGAGSLVTSDAGQFILDVGSPAMASGGMGDLLTGLVSGLVAQGMPEAEAVVAAGIWHGRAGELAGNEGERGTLASDLLPYIRQLVNGKIT
jgi:NAD(P)H-hydrate epimerase